MKPGKTCREFFMDFLEFRNFSQSVPVGFNILEFRYIRHRHFRSRALMVHLNIGNRHILTNKESLAYELLI